MVKHVLMYSPDGTKPKNLKILKHKNFFQNRRFYNKTLKTLNTEKLLKNFFFPKSNNPGFFLPWKRAAPPHWEWGLLRSCREIVLNFQIKKWRVLYNFIAKNYLRPEVGA